SAVYYEAVRSSSISGRCLLKLLSYSRRIAASAILVCMEYIRLGSTGLKVSRICLGCMTYGSKKWREWVLEEDESRPFFRRAIELGINFFDTADIYSLGVSEEITGRALKEC